MNAMVKAAPEMGLARYDAARYALQEAVAVDEVKGIRDKALAMAAYAKQAGDTALIEMATEIRVRAERKAGQMLAEMPKAKGTVLSGRDSFGGAQKEPPKNTPTLAELGVTKKQSSRWQKLAAVPDEDFERAVTAAKEVAGEVTARAIVEHRNQQKEAKPKPVKTDQRDAEISGLRAELCESRANAAELAAMVEASDFAALPDDGPAKEIKRLLDELAVVKSQRDSYMTKCNELIKSVKYWKKRAGEK